ncbi:unnamed protein product, partial [Sphagnum balticum]
PREAERRERNGYKKTQSAVQIVEEREKKKRERKNKEIGNCLPHARAARPTDPSPFAPPPPPKATSFRPGWARHRAHGNIVYSLSNGLSPPHPPVPPPTVHPTP